MARLILRPGSDDAQVLDLARGTYEIGRRPENLICIPHASVSGRHCRLSIEADKATLTDLDSTNGTYVEGERVTEVQLARDTRLRIGSVDVLFEPGFAAKEGAPPVARVRVRMPAERPAPAATGGHEETVLIGKPEPPPEPPAEPAFVGDTRCRYHPASLARYLCPQCRTFYCELCVPARFEQGTPAHYCRPCGVKCQPVRSAPSVRQPKPFGRLVLGAFRYPLQGSGWMLIVGGTFLFVLVDVAQRFAGFAGFLGLLALLVLGLFGCGYTFAYLKSIVVTSAQGSDEMPDWPDFNDWAGDVIVPLCQALGLLLLCGGPGLALVIYAGVQASPVLALAGMLLGAMGLGYLPMAVLAVSMFDGLAGANPALVVPSILRVIGHYLVATGLLLVITAGAALPAILLSALLPVPILPTVLSYAILFYALSVECRVLGVVYRCNAGKLRWFERGSR